VNIDLLGVSLLLDTETYLKITALVIGAVPMHAKVSAV
jgi:hypothetical protein